MSTQPLKPLLRQLRGGWCERNYIFQPKIIKMMEQLLAEHKNLVYFDSFISAGKSLNDKDRNINSDLKEIHEFFEPIDRLYGDYESRKKFGIQEGLYRRNLLDEIVCISKDEIEEEKKKSPKRIIIFHILKAKNSYYVEYKWDSIDNILLNGLNFKNNEYSDEGKFKKNAELITELILDPVKIYQVVAFDATRINYYCQTFWDKYRNKIQNKPLVQVPPEICSFIKAYAVLHNFVKKYQFILNFNIDTDILNYSKDKLEEILLLNKDVQIYKKNGENLEMLINAITILEKGASDDEIKNTIQCLRNEKLKNFEEFSEVRIRLGKNQSGDFILFLHPYESESNNPIRIPSE